MNQEKRNQKVQSGSRIEKKETKLFAEKNAQDCTTDFGQCFSGNSFPPQFEEECPVNYSLKYTETESCKSINKEGLSKKNFKLYPSYAETDLDQPTNFSLKYAEKNCCEEIQKEDPVIIYYPENKREYKPYTDYAETDLDHPTDFTLKYRESIEDDVKKSGYIFYESGKSETPGSYGPLEDSEETPNGPPDETPLMFSRCSSLNSLSSFVHITQSIPDDRSSVVSDFSRMTSGIISPSELPDSPTQTAPSSPKKSRAHFCFSIKPEISSNKSVFEDDVATYKQEDTPIEFSRATSLSSLNIDNAGKSDFDCKSNLMTSITTMKSSNQNSVVQSRCESPKHQGFTAGAYLPKGSFDVDFEKKLDKNLMTDRVASNIPENSSKTNHNFYQSLRKKKDAFGSEETIKEKSYASEFLLKQNIQHKLASETEKAYSAFEIADDNVHTYYTEDTPANISHAGSQTDLTAFLVSSDVSPSRSEFSRNRVFCSTTASQPSSVKSKVIKNKIYNEESSTESPNNKAVSFPFKKPDLNTPSNDNFFFKFQPRYDYLGKDLPLTAKDETATFATENSPRAFSVRSSFTDLTVSLVDSPLCLYRSENEDSSSRIETPLHNVSPQSPNSISLADNEEQEKEPARSKICDERNDYWVEKSFQRMNINGGNMDKNFTKIKDDLYDKPESLVLLKKTRFDFYSDEPLTPFEEALLEQCIRLGMPHTKKGTNFEEITKSSCTGKKTSINKNNFGNSEENSCNVRQNFLEINVDFLDDSDVKSKTVENFDFDSAEPLTLFEEALLEQCIRLGMSIKHNSMKSTQEKGLKENFGPNNSEQVTPLEVALLEQCIRMGMPKKKMAKKSEEIYQHSSDSFSETHMISNAGSQLYKLRTNGEKEKNEHLNCFCGKKYNKRRNGACKKSKKYKN